ncbi:hypothetical protein ARMSODRAFT_1020197 [Armillaria solidipes]|uniref:Uncharacterized protein n=1 Tax=Armillaria solidipes TaxID=1076256 RepID=A0A2H3B9Y7_9AGAR|nr:hypothetical protein ARMSODRAFT_1020197 [Armillaria solidipes]
MPNGFHQSFPLLNELKELLHRSPVQLSETQADVLDVLDIVLSTVGTLRALSRVSNNGTLHSTKPTIWSLLMRSLVSVCYVNSHVLEDAAFVRPHFPYVHTTMENGYAFLFDVSSLVDDIRPQNHRPETSLRSALLMRLKDVEMSRQSMTIAKA